MTNVNRAVADGQVRVARRDKDPLIHEPDWDEDERRAEWRAIMNDAGALPATLEAAILLDAWVIIELLQ